MQALLLLLCSRASSVVITWASEPVQPGETLLLSGGGFDASCNATFTTTSGAPTTLTAPAVDGHATPSSLKFIVPLALPADVFALSLACSDGASAPALLNAASPWWVQGDAGATATPGGWLRVSGLSVAWLPADALTARREERRALRALRAARTRVAEDAALAALAAARRGGGGGAAEPGAAVRLTPAGGGAPVYLPADLSNATQFSLYVPVPASLQPGEYAVAVSNGRGPGAGGAFTPLDAFYGPEAPRVGTVVVAPAAPWPASVFPVTVPTTPTNYPFPANATSDAAVAAALSAAAAAGGGTVRFGRGTFFLTQPLVVAPGVAVEGSGADFTVLVFAEATNETAPAAYFELDDAAARAAPHGTGAWAVRDLAVVITGFHYHVFSVSNFTDGFAMERVTLRANAFFAQNNAGTFGAAAPRGVQTVTHGRSANWTLEQPGNAIQLNAKNFRIVGCDIWATYNAISSFNTNGKASCVGATWPNSCHGATFGYIADNSVHHGGASHFMNQWRQVVYERNENVGASVIAMGQSVGTGLDGGFDHHILHVDNVVTSVWGNDRELMTFDDAGGAYFGRVAGADGTTLTTAEDTRSAGDIKAGGWAGGCVVVLNGTGAGQYRRVVVPGIGPEPTNPNNRTWVVDKPWDLPPDATSFIQITPYRGRNIFAGSRWSDGGAVQYYGQALENVIADATFERMTGVLAWGQWRGWVPPNRTLPPVEGPATPLGGQMGNGLMPNVRNQYLRNEYVGGWSSPNYNYTGAGASAFYARRFFAVQPLDNAPPNISGTYLLVYRDNSGGGGLNFGAGTTNVVVDGGEFALDAGTAADGPCVLADKRTALILVRNVNCSTVM
jgi:hypothetical protein